MTATQQHLKFLGFSLGTKRVSSACQDLERGLEVRRKHEQGETSASNAKIMRYTTPDGRVVNDILSLIRSPEAKEHFKGLDRLAEEGLMPRPKTSS